MENKSNMETTPKFSEIKFCRTFHPVGQGAFYSEQIINKSSGDRVFSAVYDCGCVKKEGKNTIFKAKDGILNNGNIDILFLSHFDADHINCVSELTPKYVVLPFLTDKQLKVLEVINKVQPSYLSEYELTTRELIEDKFKKSTIVYVHDDSNGGINLRGSLDIDADSPRSDKPIDLKSGAPITYSLPKPYGEAPIEYVVYQPNLSRYIEEFKNLINGAPELDWKSLIDDTENYVRDKKKFDLLKEKYGDLRPKNEHSLLVFSNPHVREQKSEYTNIFKPIGESSSSVYSESKIFIRIPVEAAGCVYFGDVTIDDRLPESFYKELKSKGYKNIGTLQVPHHGSYASAGDKIYSSEAHSSDDLFPIPPVCVISAGLQNRYGHPNLQIVQGLLSNRCPVHVVTELKQSLLSAEWNF